MKWLRGAAIGLVIGLGTATVGSALVGALYGVPLPCEPNWVSGLEGLVLGLFVYGFLTCVPAALVGAAIGAVAAKGATGGQGSHRLPDPRDLGPWQGAGDRGTASGRVRGRQTETRR